MILTDLADAARSSGLRVIEVPGWQERGHHETGEMVAVETIVCHHTATSASAPGDYPSLDVVTRGRADLPGPLAQLGLGRSGTVYVIAAGVAFHAGEVDHPTHDNWHAIGIEAEHDGLSPWPTDLKTSYARLCAALALHYGLIPHFDVQGHKEVAVPAGRKTDPNFAMDEFRDLVDDQMEALMLTKDDIRQVVREELDAFAKAFDERVKIDHDDNPKTAKVSIGRFLRGWRRS